MIMKQITLFPAAILMAYLLFSCSESLVAPTGLEAGEPAFSHQAAQAQTPAHAAMHAKNFRAHLDGASEVPPADTRGRGQATFQVDKDGTAIHYKLIVSNIENVTQAHIHRAPAGVNGPVVVWLYPGEPPAQLIEGRTDGILAEGVITAANFVGGLVGEPLESLIELMRTGEVYVNVHTSQFPPGEIRGQIY